MKHLLTATSTWLIACLQLLAADPSSPESRVIVPEVYPLAYLTLDHGWEIKFFGDGSAVLGYGSGMGDEIKVPPNTFPTARRLVDLAFAIEIAPPTPTAITNALDLFRVQDRKAWEDAEVWWNASLTISRIDTSSSKGTKHIATFIPELKAYFDRMLQANLSERMKFLTNKVPIFSDKVMKSLTDWTNSPRYRAQSAATATNAATTPKDSSAPKVTPSARGAAGD